MRRYAELTLNKIIAPRTKVGGVQYPGGPLEILVNNTKWDGMRTDAAGNMTPIPGFTPDGIANYLSETPDEGTTEIWEFVNLTMDAHPIHLHLVQFQLMNRQNFDMKAYTATYNLAFPGGVYIPEYGPPTAYGPSTLSGGKYGGNPDIAPFLMGAALPPSPNEAGWKDTIMVPPGMVTRIAVRWAPQDPAVITPASDLFFNFVPNTNGYDYVWHCHIIDHEDNEMMRPDQVISNPNASRNYFMGINY